MPAIPLAAYWSAMPRKRRCSLPGPCWRPPFEHPRWQRILHVWQ